MFFTVEKADKQLKEVRSAVYRAACDIKNFKFFAGDCQGAERPEFDDREWKDFKIGGTWGGYDQTAWFRTLVEIPAEWQPNGGERKKLVLRFLVGPRDGGGSAAESMLYVNGAALQGLDIWHEEAWLPPEVLGKGQIFVALRAWSGTIDVPKVRCFRSAQIAWVDEDSERFCYLAEAVLNSIRELSEDDLRRAREKHDVLQCWVFIGGCEEEPFS